MTKTFTTDDNLLTFTIDFETEISVLEDNILNWCMERRFSNDLILEIEMHEGGSVQIENVINLFDKNVHQIILSGDNGIIILDELEINSNF